MNAPTSAHHFMAQVTGQLLHAGYQFNDDLVLDLYGTRPTADDGFEVTSVALAGSTIELVSLFRPRQLEHIGRWLDLKDGGQTQLQWAWNHQIEAQSFG